MVVLVALSVSALLCEQKFIGFSYELHIVCAMMPFLGDDCIVMPSA